MKTNGFRFAIVVADFYQDIAARLLEGALQTLTRAGIARKDIMVHHVPGTFEIPLLVQKAARSGKFDAVIALGCVIRGETAHFDVLCRVTAEALQRIALETGVPVASGVLMTQNMEQAMVRSEREGDHRGIEAAESALRMAALLKNYESATSGA